jgi:molybdate transport system substrate-binding protein
MPRVLGSRWLWLAATVVAAAALLAAIDLFAEAPAPRPAPVTLTVFAAASLTDAFGEMAHRFETAHPGVKVRLSFAGSQQLAAQLAQGARADVFAPADRRWMDDARAHGRVDGEPRAFARNALAVIVPAANPARIGRIADLSRPGVKLVLCAVSVPAGRHARELLARLEAAPGCGPGWVARVLANVVSEEDNVRGVVGKVQLGEADAGIVYRSDVTVPLRRAVRALDVPDSLNVLAEYPIAVMADAAAMGAAHAFADYVCGAEGQATLERHGFQPVARVP